ncbi:hypothetical protein N0Y54_42980 [Nostoc punctiforme UO1]|uniref:hypothetical protein n=1 Tax=Nostoc punctiforme TaxID=272131 RepID=UPI00309FC17D
MKKLSQPISIFLSPVQLFIEDMELLEKVYKDNCESCTICTEEYELESIEELKQLDVKTLSLVELNSRHPYISLVISSEYTMIFSLEHDVKSTGIVTKLKDILTSRRSPFLYSASTWSWIIGGCTIILMFFSFQDFILSNKTVSFTVLGLELLSLIVQAFLRFGNAKFPVAYLKSKNDKRNFFLEHKNLFIAGVITLIVQLLFLWIKERIFIGV